MLTVLYTPDMLPVTIVDLSDDFFKQRNKRVFIRVPVLRTKPHHYMYDMYLYADGSKEFATKCNYVKLCFVPAILNTSGSHSNHVFVVVTEEDDIKYLADRPLQGYEYVFDESARSAFKEGFLKGLSRMGFLNGEVAEAQQP